MLCSVPGNCLKPAINVPLTVIPVTVINYDSFQNWLLTMGFFKEEGSCSKMLETKCGSLNRLLNRSLCWPGRNLQQGVSEEIPASRLTQMACQASSLQLAQSCLSPAQPTERLKNRKGKPQKENKGVTPLPPLPSFLVQSQLNKIPLHFGSVGKRDQTRCRGWTPIPH